MADTLDADGLHLEALADVVTALSDALSAPAVYGSGINLSSNSPDGQMVNIFAQASVDLRELLLLCYNSFDPDSAFGTQLDARVALNGIARQEGTFSQTAVLVTYSQAISLTGLDELETNPNATVYTVADNAGNKWQLLESFTSADAGTSVIMFQSAVIGAVLVTANTLINQSTPVTGVTSVNNPALSVSTTGTVAISSPIVTAIPTTSGLYPGMTATGNNIPSGTLISSVDSGTQVTLDTSATGNGAAESIVFGMPDTVIGDNEETDAHLRIRRTRMFSLASIGPANSVAAALLALPGVSDAFVVENATAGSVGSVPAHSIWAIVTVTSATAAQIAAAIYSKKSLGCGMYGATTQVVARPNMQSVTIKWDYSITENLFMQFTRVVLTGTLPSPSETAAALASYFLGFYKLNQVATIGDIIIAMQALYPNCYLTDVGVNNAASGYTSSIGPSDQQHYFEALAVNMDIT